MVFHREVVKGNGIGMLLSVVVTPAAFTALWLGRFSGPCLSSLPDQTTGLRTPSFYAHKIVHDFTSSTRSPHQHRACTYTINTLPNVWWLSVMAGLSSPALERLFREGLHSDFRVTCQGRECSVHKGILCAASDFFRAACERNFKVKSTGPPNTYALRADVCRKTKMAC